MSFHLVTRHLPRLDSVRGLAALVVAASHIWPLYLDHTWSVIIDGRIAVTIFFVLSGLVLGMSLRRGGALTFQTFGKFWTRRFFRIYPAYFVCTIPYLFMQLLLIERVLQGKFIGEGHFNEHYHLDNPVFPSIWETVENFTFLKQDLNGVTWTLKVEAQAALIFPFLHLYSSLVRWKGKVLMLLALIVLSIFSPGNTGLTLWLFYGGYLLPLALKRLGDLQWKMENFVFFLLLASVMATFVASHPFSHYGAERHPAYLLAGTGAIILLGLVLADFNPHSSFFRVLDFPVFRFMGAISYSFYLLNIVCQDATHRILTSIPVIASFEKQSMAALFFFFVVGTLVTTAMATLSHRFIERPFIKFGARFYQDGAQPEPIAR